MVLVMQKKTSHCGFDYATDINDLIYNDWRTIRKIRGWTLMTPATAQQYPGNQPYQLLT